MELSKEKESIGRALGRIPSGVFVLTARSNGVASAMLASWVMQAAFAPPTISIAIAQGRPIGQMIRDSGMLAISIISAEDKSLMKHYARGFKENDDPFAGIATTESPGGCPVLSDSLGWMEGKLLSTYAFGADHELFIAQIVAGEILRPGLAFAHQRGNGFHY